MAYESVDRLKQYMQKKVDAIATGEQVKFNINAHELLDEINEMEQKVKAFDEINKIIARKLTEEEEQYLLQSEQDVGQYKAYNYIDDIIQEHMAYDSD